MAVIFKKYLQRTFRSDGSIPIRQFDFAQLLVDQKLAHIMGFDVSENIFS